MYQPENLIKTCRTLLKRRKGKESRKQIAERAGVGVEWLNKLAQGRLENPTYSALTKLFNYLKHGERDGSNRKKDPDNPDARRPELRKSKRE